MNLKSVYYSVNSDPKSIEIFGKERKYKVYQKLCAEIHQYQRAQQGIGNSKSFPEGNKQHRR